MNAKELSELRRRFQPDKTAIARIHGCYVNAQKQVVSYIDESLGLMPPEEGEYYLGLLKKILSGAMGKNLIDVVFSNEQVMDSDEHRLLSALRDSGLKDREVREQFYQKVIDSLDMEGENYLILMAHDAYDVPFRGKDGLRQDEGGDSRVFHYIVCCVCPVKDGKFALGYFPGENEFHNCSAGQVVAPPELGFLFPAFDDRTANIYNALFYSRSPDQLHQEFIDGIFHVESPMSPEEQKATFRELLTEALDTGCDLSLAQAVHSQLSERIAIHKESRDPEPLTVSAGEMGGVLSDCGVPEEKVAAFQEAWGREFGKGVVASPENLIDAKRFELKSGSAVITLDPEQSFLIETRIIDGRRYLLIPADAAAELNGFPIKLG